MCKHLLVFYQNAAIMGFDIVTMPLIVWNMEKIKKIKQINEYFSLYLIALVLFSCGKSSENPSASDSPRNNRANNSDLSIPLGRFYSSQTLKCDDPLFCPDNVAKLVVVVNDNIKYCTGTLIDKDKILTSASCLPKELRIPRISCNQNIVAVFPKTIYSDEEIVACDKIEYIDENLFVEPALWQNDLVVLSLAKKLNRSFSKVSLDGVRDKEKLIGWSVNYETETKATLNSVKCTTVLNTFLNPFSVSTFSSMVVMNACELNDGSVGTAFIRDGEIVSVYSEEMSGRLYSYLGNSGIMKEKLSRYYHMSNVACSNTNIASFVSGVSKDCFVPKTTKLLDKKRSRVLKGMVAHKSTMEEILNSIWLPSKYFLWTANFRATGKSREFEVFLERPKCINESRLWISEYRRWRRRIKTYARISFDLPKYIVRTKLDSNLLTVSEVEGPINTKHQFEFNPFDAHVNKKTYVKLSSWKNGLQVSKKFNNINADCVN